MKQYIYLDDVRTPTQGVGEDNQPWVVVRSYDEFVEKVNEIGLENIQMVSLDHDLGDTAMTEWKNNVYHNYKLDYDNITEKTGYDVVCYMEQHNKWPTKGCYVHSANPVGKNKMLAAIQKHAREAGLE